MSYLIVGLVLFFLIHMIPSLPSLKTAIVGSVGAVAYRAGFSVLAIASLILIVVGLRGVEFVALYEPPAWGRNATFVLAFVAVYLFFSNSSAPSPSSVKALTASPLSWGVVSWSAGHLLSNGDLAHVLLFAMFLAFGLISIFSSYKRGLKPVLDKRPPVVKELVFVVIVALVYGGLIHGHRYFTGMPIV